MTREEAINEIKSWDFLNEKEIEAIQTLIPELRESEDERMIKWLHYLIEIAYTTDLAWDIPKDDTLAWLEKQKEQKPAEWSEEDENKIESIKGLITTGKFADTNTIRTIWKLLDSLRPLPKQEWSEEDEKDMAHIIRILNDCYAYGKHDLSKTDHENLVNKLKSLRPSWKPSEEQMEAFKGYIKDFQEKAEAAVGGWNNFDVMIRLFEQLKKLM